MPPHHHDDDAVFAASRRPEAARRALHEVLHEVQRTVVGQDDLLERLLVAVLTGGHVLLEGVPGLAKTLTVRTLAQTVGGSFGRIQFTPDLVPSDVVGTRVLRPGATGFDVELGPVFCHFLLADEVNRAPAKVQSALLEVMQERQATIAGVSHHVPEPFLVLATQNPVESEGTYPLPEAQTDRFLMKLVVDYPDAADEVDVVGRSLVQQAPTREQLTLEELEAVSALAREVHVDRRVIGYAVSLAEATRFPARHGLQDLERLVALGASPRGPLGLVHAARSLALLRGRGHVRAEDVADLAADVLRHRITPTYEALAEGVRADDVLARVLDAVPRPAASDLRIAA
ncbi:MoxR family ATPase [Conexibacter sp. SYSU D00693]|uniref:AAA family ATPase n=1 Tax=Conexibacter sp. SYSU D00693 TaxID=2812560 RepID=UPI00196A6169|nr:MoxR family ATPase [Conexibacter sp. SYSU D00693]